MATGWNCATNPVLFDCNNRLKILNAYDGAGNMIYLPNSTISQQYLAYDAENRLTVQTVTAYVYEAEGSLAASYQYGGAAGPSGTFYANQDHLGSTRLVTQGGAAKACHDYLPFGEEIPGGVGTRAALPCYVASVTQEKFTGQVRDAESGLDLLGARYMASSLGRFMSPDPGGAGADAGNPQSWNMYSYGLNNPMLLTDTGGLDPCVDGVNPDTGNICAVGTASGGGTDSPFPWDFFWRSFGSSAAQTAVEITDVAVRYINAPRDPNCVAAYAAAGKVLGAGLGFQAGSGTGALLGAGAGTLALPGGGTIGGAALGYSGGGALGAFAGYYGGGAIGTGAGWLACSQKTADSSGSGGGGDPASTEPTPTSSPESFKPLNGRPGKINIKTGDPLAKLSGSGIDMPNFL